MVISLLVSEVVELIQTVSLPLTPPTSVTMTGTTVSATLKVTVTLFASQTGDWSLSTLST